MSKPTESFAGTRGNTGGSCVAQILIELKNPDPTGRTAEEAIRTLLGFGDRLVALRRREFHELVCRPKPGTDPATELLAPVLLRYLRTTAVLWNANKQRAWLRIEGACDDPGPWEVISGGSEQPGPFGDPNLEDPDLDHVMVWGRGRETYPEEMEQALSGWSLPAAGSCELYTLRWKSESTQEERQAWTGAVSTARSRGSGLLVNPHCQDHRLLFGPVHIPFWRNERNPRDAQVS